MMFSPRTLRWATGLTLAGLASSALAGGFVAAGRGPAGGVRFAAGTGGVRAGGYVGPAGGAAAVYRAPGYGGAAVYRGPAGGGVAVYGARPGVYGTSYGYPAVGYSGAAVAGAAITGAAVGAAVGAAAARPNYVYSLPAGYAPVMWGGTTYYAVGGVYYQPVVYSGTTVYQQVTPPPELAAPTPMPMYPGGDSGYAPPPTPMPSNVQINIDG